MKSISITRLKLLWGAAPHPANFSPEMKSISITRLKRNRSRLDHAPLRASLKWKASRLRDWNLWSTFRNSMYVRDLKWKASRLRDWNYLKAQLTCNLRPFPEMKSISITRLKHHIYDAGTPHGFHSLKWKASRLRDWNNMSACSRASWMRLNSSNLKWKASRLRDWNH